MRGFMTGIRLFVAARVGAQCLEVAVERLHPIPEGVTDIDKTITPANFLLYLGHVDERGAGDYVRAFKATRYVFHDVLDLL